MMKRKCSTPRQLICKLGAGGFGTVTLEGLKITGGSAADDGGGLSVAAAMITVMKRALPGDLSRDIRRGRALRLRELVRVGAAHEEDLVVQRGEAVLPALLALVGREVLEEARAEHHADAAAPAAREARALEQAVEPTDFVGGDLLIEDRTAAKIWVREKLAPVAGGIAVPGGLQPSAASVSVPGM